MKGLLTRKLLWKKTKSYPVNFTTYDDDDYFIGRKRLVSFKNVVRVRRKLSIAHMATETFRDGSIGAHRPA